MKWEGDHVQPDFAALQSTCKVTYEHCPSKMRRCWFEGEIPTFFSNVLMKWEIQTLKTKVVIQAWGCMAMYQGHTIIQCYVYISRTLKNTILHIQDNTRHC
jgi:hypothetical protein